MWCLWVPELGMLLYILLGIRPPHRGAKLLPRAVIASCSVVGTPMAHSAYE